MRLLRVGAPGAETPAALAADGTCFDLRSLTGDIDGAFLAGDSLVRARDAVGGGSLPVLDITGQRIGAPVSRPGVVLCIGMNYAAHAAESGSQPPQYPVVFYKAPNTVVGPDDEVLNPRGAAKLDWEVELAVVIGARARYLDSPEQALGHVAGYAISNDVSERAFQIEISGGQWSKGKSCETFNPLGPWLVTADEIGDPQGLGIRSRVNGEVRQNSSTKDMIFSVAEIIYQLSQVTVLEPGDIINTGTPEGVALGGRFPYLAPGDVMELEIDGLGRQRQVIGQA
jgi:2-keto-4-pentenoate hydratase/2-oxohepta-3-ene-1,7-dioic acid hydratase in catechol pathway